jgi:serine/threonine-protein kinase
VTTPDQQRLGPFLLGAAIGRGGMGRVYRGFHSAQSVPVAIKVLTNRKARNPLFHAAFANEVRAMAGLDHPGVVMVMD